MPGNHVIEFHVLQGKNKHQMINEPLEALQLQTIDFPMVLQLVAMLTSSRVGFFCPGANQGLYKKMRQNMRYTY